MNRLPYNGWLVYDRAGAERNAGFIRKWEECSVQAGIRLSVLLDEQLDIGVARGRLFCSIGKRDLPLPDFAVMRTFRPLLSRQLELLGVRVFNAAAVSELCNDKNRTCQLLAASGIPVADSMFQPAQGRTERCTTYCGNEVVIKTAHGHGGTEVFLATDQTTIAGQIAQLHGKALIAQRRIGTLAQDLRVYLLGGRILAAILRTSTEGFRANFSLGGTAQPYRLDAPLERLVAAIAKLLPFDFVGIDFLFDDRGRPICNEIEDVVGCRMLYSCGGIDAAKEYLAYICTQL